MAVGTLSTSSAQTAADTYSDVWHPKRGVRWNVVARHAVLIAFCALVLLPLFWVFLLSLKSIPDGVQRYIWPKNFMEPLTGHYEWVLEKRPDVIQTFWNSVLVTSGTVCFATITAVLAGYALVHLRTPGQRVIIAFLVASTFFPTRVTALVGIYDMQSRLGLINVTWGLIMPYTALSLAISIFIMRGVFETVPKDIVDSAKVDGASSFRTLTGIILPLVRNGIVVVIIVNFVAAWGEYLLANTLMNSAGNKTLPVFIANAGGGLGAWFWPRLSALYILAILPGLIIFALTQRWYMAGLQEGALKA